MPNKLSSLDFVRRNIAISRALAGAELSSSESRVASSSTDIVQVSGSVVRVFSDRGNTTWSLADMASGGAGGNRVRNIFSAWCLTINATSSGRKQEYAQTRGLTQERDSRWPQYDA